LVVLLVASFVRLWGLPSPPNLYWDEQYYVFDAEVYLGGGIGQPITGAPAVKIADEGTWVHPPMGKWIIALFGVGPMGLRSIGWRLPSALFGIAGVGLVYLLALRLWRSVWWAGLAALLLALDGLHIVQSRLAMLDIFLTTFITAGVLFLVLDRERSAAGHPPRRWPRVARFFGSSYRLWAGVMFGAAMATKWAGAYALLFGAVLCSAWALPAAARRGRSIAATAGTLVASFAVVPLAVYLLSYGAFFYQHGFAVRDFVTLQLRMLDYQRHHSKVQPENSQPWTWPLLLHPIQYFALVRGSSASRIVALGNPALWWGFLALMPWGLVRLVRRPSWQDAVLVGGFAAMFGPWLLVPRSQFIFYMTPAVPFMCLCVTTWLRALPDRISRDAGIAFAAAVVVVATAFMPAWTGWWFPLRWSSALRWLHAWPF
jgi:dolichyl-phosphate-mannose--protein O-mannosyl transferase